MQYIILGVFLCSPTDCGGCRCAERLLCLAGREEPHSERADSRAARQDSRPQGRIIVDNYPSFSALLLRDSSARPECRRGPDRARPAYGCRRSCASACANSPSMPQYQPIFLKDDITPDELAFIESHRNELPELDTIMAHRRLYPRNGFMAHLIGYVGEVSEDMLQPAAMGALQSRRRGGHVGSREAVQRHPDGQERLAAGAGQQPRQEKSGRCDETPAVPGQAAQADHRSRPADRRRRSAGGKERRDRCDGSAQRRDSGHGEPPGVRSQRLRGRISRDEWNKLVNDPRQAAAEQSHPGAARSRARCSRSSWRPPECRKASRRT